MKNENSNIDISVLREGDWMEVQSFGLLGKLIRFRCGSYTNHGQPIHVENGKLYVLNATVPRLKVDPIESWIEDAKKKSCNFIIMRQTYLPVEIYSKAALQFEADIAKKRPFYDVISFVKFIWELPILAIKYNKIMKMLEKDIYFVSLASEPHLRMIEFSKFARKLPEESLKKTEVLMEYKKFAERFDRISESLWYCTELLKGIYVTAGDNPFKKLYNVDYCTPKEVERFTKDKYMIFLCGYYNGTVSDELYKKIVI